MSSLLSAEVDKLPPCDDPQKTFSIENYQEIAHIPPCFTLPLDLLGVYCILFKTSPKMGNYKFHLLTHQIWLLLTDVLMSYLVTPVIFFPVVGGSANGLLQRIGVPVLLQFWLAIACAMGSNVAIAVLFAYRHQAIIPPSSILHIKSTTVKRIIVGAEYFILCNMLTIPVLMRPADQIEALNAASLDLECVLPGFRSGSAFIMEAKAQPPLMLIIIFATATVFDCEVLVCSIHSAWNLYIINSRFSKRTMQMQKMYFFQMCMQGNDIAGFVVVIHWEAMNITSNMDLLGVTSGMRDVLEKLPACEVPGSLFSIGNFRMISHATSSIIFVINLFGVYCIVLKSSPSMTIFKYYLLVYQLWILLSDVSIALFLTPAMYVPIMGGCCFGLLTDVGVPMRFQAWLGSMATFSMGASIPCLFACRHQLIMPPTSRWRVASRTMQVLYISGHYMFCWNTWTVSLITRPVDQIQAQFDAAQALHCIPPGMFTNCAYVLEGIGQFRLVVPMAAAVIFISVFEVVVFSVHSIWYLSTAVHLSQKTRRMQRTFVYSLIIQITVPITMLNLPAIYYIYSFKYDVYNQAINNFAIYWFSLHGAASTLSLILCNETYRNFVFKYRNGVMHKLLRLIFWRHPIAPDYFAMDVPISRCTTAVAVTIT